MREDQQQLGIAELANRLAKSGFRSSSRSDLGPITARLTLRLASQAGKPTLCFPTNLLRDLPATREYQEAVDSYSVAVAGRVRCGSPDLFYCSSHVAISVGINWPIQAAVVDNRPSAWLLVNVTDERQGRIAKCCLNIERHFGSSGCTILDDVRAATNRIRNAIDDGAVTFYDRQSHPQSYQAVGDDVREAGPTTPASEIEKFCRSDVYACL